MDELLKVQSSLPGPIYNRCKYVINENIRVLETVQAIKENNVTQIGELLYQSHLGLKDLYEVSCAELDYLVQRGKESSVIVGSRLMGGGFGGCTINLIQIGMTNQFIYSIADDYKRKFNKELNYYDIRLTTGTRQFIS